MQAEESFWRVCKTFRGDVLKRLWECVQFIMGCLMETLKVEKGRYLGGSGRKRSGNIEGRWDKRGQSAGNRHNGTVHLCLITTIYSIYTFNPFLSSFCVDAPLF